MPPELTGAASLSGGAAQVSPVKTRRWFVVAGLIVGLAAVTFWRPLQQKTLVWMLLAADAPSEAALTTAIENSSNKGDLLCRLWNTQKLPHRQFVLGQISTTVGSKPQLTLQLQNLILEATQDPDVDTRQNAFRLLARLKSPQLLPLALQQLNDADPAVRVLAIQSLSGIATSNEVAVLIERLRDSDPRVVVAAGMLLKRLTGQDLGLKSADALPQFTCIGTNPPPEPNRKAIELGVHRWHEWWADAKSAYPASTPATLSAALPLVLAGPKIDVSNLDGSPMPLSQFRGKVLLLAFWSPVVSASLNDFRVLGELQQNNPEGLAVVGICIPEREDCCAGDDHGGPGGGHHEGHSEQTSSTTGGQTSKDLRTVAENFKEALSISFPMCLDVDGAAAQRFVVADTPVYVLLDAQGNIRRRIVGFRTRETLAALVGEILSHQTENNKTKKD
jgi:hypothetical protein